MGLVVLVWLWVGKASLRSEGGDSSLSLMYRDWLSVSRCHMLSPPSLVCRGTGASGAAWTASTMTHRTTNASLVTRPVLPVQVRVRSKVREIFSVNKYFFTLFIHNIVCLFLPYIFPNLNNSKMYLFRLIRNRVLWFCFKFYTYLIV